MLLSLQTTSGSKQVSLSTPPNTGTLKTITGVKCREGNDSEKQSLGVFSFQA